MSTAKSHRQQLIQEGEIKLHQLPQKQAELEALLEASEGELTIEIENWLSQIQEEVPGRMGAAARVIDAIEADQHFLSEKINELLDRKARGRRTIDRLKKLLGLGLDLLGVEKVHPDPLCEIRRQRNSMPSVVTDLEPEELPVEYLIVKTEIDRKAILGAWKDGYPLPEGVKVAYGNHIRVRS